MTDKQLRKFINALIKNKCAWRNDEDCYIFLDQKIIPPIAAKRVQELASQGIVALSNSKCEPTPLARNWLKRKLLEGQDLADQHREIVVKANGTRKNLAQGTLGTLVIGQKGAQPFMQRHHVEAANRIEKLVEQAQMRQRTTMSYDPTRVGGKSGSGSAGPELGGRAIDARNTLNACLGKLAPDCAGVVLDVCGLQKGLQLVEQERKWPRRSAKMILRVGLDQVAIHFGITPSVIGSQSNRPQQWIQHGFRANQF